MSETTNQITMEMIHLLFITIHLLISKLLCIDLVMNYSYGN